jgi:hypothetical protein
MVREITHPTQNPKVAQNQRGFFIFASHRAAPDLGMARKGWF